MRPLSIAAVLLLLVLLAMLAVAQSPARPGPGKGCRQIISSGRPDLSADAVERDVASRMERQLVPDREELFAWFVISEAVLRTPYGGPEVMHRQVVRLAEAARE